MQRIKLSTVPGVVNAGINLSQYDVGREIAFDLYDYNGPHTVGSTDVITMRATKPSGFAFEVTATTASSNTVVFEVTDTMSAESGSFPAELRIANGGDILGTANFLWNVERAPKQDGTIDGNAEARNLMQAINAAITDAETAAAAANNAALTAGFSEDFKEALLDCFEHVAWIDGDGQDYYDALESALYPPIPATSISLNKSTIAFHVLNAEETLVATVQPVNTTDSVSWSSSDTSVATVDSSGKVKAIADGSATITATAGSVSATCAVTVAELTLSSISAVFTQGTHVVYSDDTLDSLKPYLVVTATYSDSSSEVIDSSAYTLSGTLTVGTSTITATYMTKTDTFSVTVTQAVQHFAIVNNLTHTSSSNASTTTVDEGDSYTTSIGVEVGYTLQSVTVTMGGVDITSTAWNSGTQTISIASVTGNVVITATAAAAPSSLTATFTQGSTIIYDTADLDDLKQYLVVVANYSGGTTETVPSNNYTLSGTLTPGTSTITVTYLGVTTTFTADITSLTPAWVNNVMTLTPDNGIVQGQISNNYPYNGGSAQTTRVCYVGLDVDVSTSYKYTIEYTSTKTTTNVGAQGLKSAAVTAVQNQTSIGTNDKVDSGWQSSGYEYTPTSSIQYLWFAFRAGSGSTAITPANFPVLKITREAV